jgi:hypothetical protein
VAAAPGLPDVDVLVLRVADRADGGAAARRTMRISPQGRRSVARSPSFAIELDGGAGGTGPSGRRDPA